MMDFVSEVVACLRLENILFNFFKHLNNIDLLLILLFRMLHNQSSNCITLHQFFVCIIEKLTPWLQNFVSSQENNLNFYDVAGDITIFLASWYVFSIFFQSFVAYIIRVKTILII